MKRKLPSTLTPIRVPGSSANSSTKFSSRDFASADPYDMSPSPKYTSRRDLSPRTDRALKDACQTFAKYNNCEEDDLKLDFELVHRYTRKSAKEERLAQQARPQPRSDLPLRIIDHTYANHSAHHFGEQDDNHYSQDTSRRRDSPQQSWKDPSVMDRGRSKEQRFKPIGSYAMNDSDESFSTPRTESTDHLDHNASTAMTSAAAMSPKPHSKRDSRRKEKESSAAEAVRDVFAKRRQESAQASQQPSARPSLDVGPRSLSRTRSFREGLKHYIRPRSRDGRNGSRNASTEDLSRTASGDGATSGWRNWGLRRMGSKRSLNSRPGSSNAETQAELKPSKPAVDLNRELPPLPGLDQWKPEPEDQEMGEPGPVEISPVVMVDSVRSSTGRVMEARICEAKPVKLGRVMTDPVSPVQASSAKAPLSPVSPVTTRSHISQLMVERNVASRSQEPEDLSTPSNGMGFASASRPKASPNNSSRPPTSPPVISVPTPRATAPIAPTSPPVTKSAAPPSSKRDSKPLRMPSFTNFDFDSLISNIDRPRPSTKAASSSKPPRSATTSPTKPHRKHPSIDVFSFTSTAPSVGNKPSVDFSRGTKSKHSIDLPPSAHSNHYTHKKSTSLDQGSTTPNFSRKVSRDFARPHVQPQQQSDHERFPSNSYGPFVEITAGPTHKASRSGLRKAFVGLFSRKGNTQQARPRTRGQPVVVVRASGESEDAAEPPIIRFGPR